MMFWIGVCPHLQVEPVQLGLTDKASLSLSLSLSVPAEYVPPEDQNVIQSPKLRVLNKRQAVTMFRIVIVILIYHRHKPTDSINLLGS
jgi:hypothetical protein